MWTFPGVEIDFGSDSDLSELEIEKNLNEKERNTEEGKTGGILDEPESEDNEDIQLMKLAA